MTFQKGQVPWNKDMAGRIIILLALAILITPVANALSVNKNATNTTIGVTGFTTPANAFINDSLYAVTGISCFVSPVSQYYTNFSLSIPAGATIDGLEVWMQHKHVKASDTGALNVTLRDGSGSLIGNAKYGANDGHAGDTIEIFGSSTDTWGATLTPTVVNADAFGILTCYNKSAGGGGNKASINEINITIYYTTEDTTPPNIANFNLVNVSNRSFYNETQGYNFTAEVSDASGISNVWFEHNFSGTPYNYTANLLAGSTYEYKNLTVAAGFYYYRWWANDTNASGFTGNLNSTTNQLYQINRSSPRLNITIDGGFVDKTINQAVAYVTYAYVNGSNRGDRLTQQGRVELFYNDTASTRLLLNISAMNVTNGSSSIAVGGYLFNATYNETQNYTRDSFTLLLTVTDAPSLPAEQFSITLAGAPSGNISFDVAPGNITEEIWFNSSNIGTKYIQPCRGDTTGNPPASSCQDSTVPRPMLLFTNLGSNPLNFTIEFNASLPASITVWMNVSNGTDNIGCSTYSEGANDTVIGTTAFKFALGVCTGNATRVYLFANYTYNLAGVSSNFLNYSANRSLV